MIEYVSLKEAVSSLPLRERQVIALRYYKGLTQEKTARVMKVSQVQVSRLERKAMESLKKF
jgi:RNA polymerase sporulation-specific sigma factor